MTEREELEKAMAALEQQRPVLGEAAVEAALVGLQQKLSALEGEEPVSQEQLITRLMPQALADKMRATRHAEGERKKVTVLFADLAGYTPLSERLDPEVVMSLSQDLLRELAQAVYEHEGYVVQFMGDAVMAVFGAPLTHEDDAERAVHAALDMRERIETLNRRWQTRLGQSLRLHIGLNTGMAVTGRVGSDLRMADAVIGDTTNTAQRLQSAAPPGDILVSVDTYRLAREAFTFAALEPLAIKGKREPLLAYQVLGVQAQPGRRRGLEGQGLSSPLVGRATELQTIQACVQHLVEQGQGGIVGILGEAGLGKSRLIAETKTYLAAQNANVLWLEGQTLSFGQTISYWPFQQILRGWAGISEEDDADATWSKLETHVRALCADETIDYLPYLASLLALEVRSEYAERVKYLDGDAMGKQIFLTARRFFERLGRAQPTLLVFEDLHWMDESSSLLLEHLLPLVASVPLVIFGVSRPERDTPAARLRALCAREYAGQYSEVQLAPLSGADSTQLMDNLLAIENFPAKLRELVLQRAEGNPFFLEEVIRTLLDTGAVEHDAASGHWRATAQLDTIRIPDTIQGVIMARVDRLDEEVKQVLRLAAVIGRSFLYRVLKAMAEAGQQLDDNLTELQASEFIREKQHLPELEYMFRHALAQEATYESILLQKRRKLHARVAQAVESLFAERLEEFYGLLAYHYARAEAWDKAQAYLLKAADQAGQLAGDAEALALYDQAVAAYARAFGDRWDPAQRAAVERKVGEALFRRGDNVQALEHMYRGLAYLGQPFPTSHGKIRQAIVQGLLQQAGNRLLPRLFLRPATAPPSAAFEEEYYLHDGIAQILALQNIEGFLLATIRFLNRAEQNKFLLGMGRGFAAFGVILDFAQAFGIAESYHRRALALAQQLQNPRVTDVAHYMMGLHVLLQGKLDLALEHVAQAATAGQESGELRQWGFDMMAIGEILYYRGDLDHARQQGTALVHLGQDAVARQLEAMGETVQGAARKRMGHLDKARVHLERACKLSAMVPDYYVGVLARGELGQCLVRQGEFAQALAVLETGEQLGVQHKTGGNSYTHLLHGQAECFLAQAERASQSEKQDWLRKAQRACQAALKQVKAFRPGAPEAMLLQGRYEWLRGQPAAARQWWNKSLAEAERMGMRCDEAMTHLEMGRRLGEQAHLEKAESIFAEIGAELPLARARQLLQDNIERHD